MSAAQTHPLARLFRLAPMLRLREVVTAALDRLHLVRLDRTRPDRAQLRALLGLMQRARRTPFGRDHDFRRIRSAEDFRRLVPLRTPAVLARDYPLAEPDCAATWDRARATTRALIRAVHPRTPLHDRIAWPDQPIPPGVEPVALVLPHEVIGPSRTLSLRALWCPEAVVAVEDPRISRLRLLLDHGVYYEFVPAEQRDERQPTRLGLGEVRVAQVYELAITSPAGWWACRSGLFIEFTHLDVPTIRVVPAPARPEPVTSPVCHPRTDDRPAALPERSARSPWSVPADRG